MTTQTKIALITGGNRGLGRATALALAEAGIDSVITYRSGADQAAATVEQARALGRTVVARQLDTADLTGFDRFAGELAAVLKTSWDRDTFDFLVNNAGVGIAAPFAETTVEQFDQLLNVHFKGVFFLTQRLLGLLADGGRIVNVSTGLARFSFPGMSAYASMKGAVEVLTRYLAKELGPRGISVNAIAPGATATDFGGGQVRDDQQMRGGLEQMTAHGRVGEARDIGGAVAALLADGTGWITGQRIEASGGMLL